MPPSAATLSNGVIAPHGLSRSPVCVLCLMSLTMPTCRRHSTSTQKQVPSKRTRFPQKGQGCVSGCRAGSPPLEKLASGLRRGPVAYRRSSSTTTTVPIEIKAHDNVVRLGAGVCERSGLIVIVLVLHCRQHAHKEGVRNTGGPKAWSGMINRTSYRRFELLPGG